MRAPENNLPIETLNLHSLAQPDSILRMVSQPVVHGSKVDLSSLLTKLRATLTSIEYGAGLAAVQVGIPLRVAIVNLRHHMHREIVLINPVLLSLTGGNAERQEGCLSLPGYKGPVTRRNKLVVQSMDVHGGKFSVASSGYEAAVIQHEIDHMDGILYSDKLTPGAHLRKI